MYAADSTHSVPALEEKLQAIYKLRGGATIDLTIRKPYIDLLTALGSPHENLPPVIHVAGTNGKGSTIAMLRTIFETSGYNVHTYTSPHLIRFNERIILAGKEIDDTQLEALLDEVMSANKNAPLTFFEITTAMAFTAFSRTPADIVLLETGLGGRLDCCNIVTKPLATIITHIGRDHMEFLGESLPEIAAEKAGIMKPGVPCILAPQTSSSIESVFKNRAKEIGCSLIIANAENAPDTNMIGIHQRENAAAALACLKEIKGFDIFNAGIEAGLQNVSWPGRLQQINDFDLPSGTELWLDGGHNESAGRALAAQAKLWAEQDDKPLHLILGMMKTKDPASFIRPLLPYINKISCVSIPSNADAYTANELKTITEKLANTNIITEDNLEIAIKTSTNNKNHRIIIAGSIYLAGYILKAKTI